MKNFLKLFLIFGFLITLIFFLRLKTIISIPIWTSDVQMTVKNIRHIKIAGKTLKIELALTSEAQQKGLSGRERLKINESMLFVFDRPGKYEFWMKDMSFPIDIIWIGEDMRIVYIKKNALPESYPEVFTSDQDAQYVLEVVSRFSEENNLKEEDEVEFLPF